MSEMIVQVRNKMLRRIGGVNHFVSHNKDYTIQFQFDESWDNVRTKMAVFAYEDGEYGSEIFDGDTCNVPELPREGRILIGVKAGEDLSTELLCIPVCKSADDVITDEYDEPDPKIYEQILNIINNLWNGGTTVYPSPVKFLASPSAAKVGDLIRVKEVDENGDVTRTEGFDVGVELEKKIDAPQVAQVGEVLTVEEVDAEGKPKKWKTAPAAAEQKQADWNQNDETAADYVKNRPFYTEIIEKTFESSADNNYIEFNGVPFKAGDSVDITVDGERFTLIAQVDTDPEYPEMIIGAYIGDSYDDIQSGSGQYGWQYYYTEEGNVSGIISSENHIFIYKTVEDHKLDMKYSPVQISESVTTNNINHIDSLLIFNDIKTKGLTVSWDEEFNSYVLMSIDNLSPCTTTIIGNAGYEVSSTLNVEHSFPFKSTGLQHIINNNLHLFGHHRLIFNAVVLNGRGYMIALTSSTDNQYTVIDLKNTIYLTGSFVTAEGYLYLVILEIVVSEDKTIQNSSKLKIKRIL